MRAPSKDGCETRRSPIGDRRRNKCSPPPTPYFNVEACGGELSRISANFVQPTWRQRHATVSNIEIWGGVGGEHLFRLPSGIAVYMTKNVLFGRGGGRRPPWLFSIVANHCDLGKKLVLIAMIPASGNSVGFP